jgi:tetratricopeptide (TPR) repeat protein
MHRYDNNFTREQVALITSRCEDWVNYERQTEARQVMQRLLQSKYCGAYQYCILGATYISDIEDNSDFPSARKYLDQALKLDPNFAQTYFRLAVIELSSNRTTEALRLLDKALSFKTASYSRAWIAKANVLATMGRTDEAYKAACQAEDLMPNDAGVLWSKAGIMEQMGKHYEAAMTFEKSYQFYQSDWLLHQIIHCLDESGHYEEALVELKKLFVLTPSDADAYRLRAGIYRKMKRYDESLKDMNRAIELEPSSIAYKERAKIFELTGKPDKARADLQAAAKLVE